MIRLLLFCSLLWSQTNTVLFWLHPETNPSHSAILKMELQRNSIGQNLFQWASQQTVDSILLQERLHNQSPAKQYPNLIRKLSPNFVLEAHLEALQHTFQRESGIWVTGEYQYTLALNLRLTAPSQEDFYAIRLEADTTWSTGFCGISSCKAPKVSTLQEESIHKQLLQNIIARHLRNLKVLLTPVSSTVDTSATTP